MLYNYVYGQQPSYLMEFKCNFDFMPVYTSYLRHSNSYDIWMCKDKWFQSTCYFCSCL